MSDKADAQELSDAELVDRMVDLLNTMPESPWSAKAAIVIRCLTHRFAEALDVIGLADELRAALADCWKCTCYSRPSRPCEWHVGVARATTAYDSALDRGADDGE